MGILFNKKEFVLNFDENKPTRYRIRPVRQPAVTFDKLLDEVSSSCGVGRPQVKATVEALMDRMTLFMDYGMPVSLGDFGTFKPTFKVQAKESEDELDASNVKSRRIQFWPGKRLRSMLSDISLTPYNSKTKAKEGTGGTE